ncbi:MAG: hypothetical protein AAF713_10385 [Pseudomonadota bacterium]
MAAIHTIENHSAKISGDMFFVLMKFQELDELRRVERIDWFPVDRAPAISRLGRVRSQPGAARYRSVTAQAWEEPSAPLCAPDLSLSLAAILRDMP